MDSKCDLTSRENYLISFTFILVLILHATRNIPQLVSPILYGEEGKIFFLEAYELGVKSLATTYSGYLHTFPRLIALAFSEVDLPNVAVIFHLSSLLAHSILLYAVIRWSSGFDVGPRLIALLATILLPHAGEVYLNLPNTTNLLGPVTWLIILSPVPHQKIFKLLDCFVVFLAALSGPYALLACPAVAWILIRRRKINLTIAAAMFGGAIQLSMLNYGIRERIIEPLTFSVLMTAFNAFSFTFLLGWLPIKLSLDQSIGVLILLFLFGAWCFRKRPFWPSERALILLFSAAMVWVAGIFLGIGNPSWNHPLGAGQRYFWAPYVMTTLAIVDWGRLRISWMYTVVALIFFSGISNWHLRLPEKKMSPAYVYNEATGLVSVRVYPSYWNFEFRPKPENLGIYKE